MPVASLRGVVQTEPTSSFNYADFTVTLDAPAFVASRIYFFTQDATASGRRRDYNETNSFIDIPAGEIEGTIRVPIYRDGVPEGDETFSLVAYGGPNVTMAGGAAALRATATIVDIDDFNVSSPPVGPAALATPIFGPTSASSGLPTLSMRSDNVIEGNSSFDYANILLTLDRVATTAVTVNYYVQEVSASIGERDIGAAASTITIPAGQQATYIRVPVYGDTLVERNESYEVVLTNISNAVFQGNASALKVKSFVVDDDGGVPSIVGGFGQEAVEIDGPGSVGPLPTVRVHEPEVIEGDSSFRYANFLITTDKQATAPITGSYYTVDGTASGALRDYAATASSFTIPTGATSTTIRVAVYGDGVIEGDETFGLVLTGLTNGQFEGDAPALISTAKILGDDGGPISELAGIGGRADAAPEPRGTAEIVPTLQVHDLTVIEGNSSFQTVRFLVTLDRPAPANISFDYAVMDGSATSGVDFTGTARSLTIPAGQSSASIAVTVRGDLVAEGNEDFFLVLSGINNANFANNAPALVARGIILDNDGGEVQGTGGIGAPSPGAVPPAPDSDGIVARLVSTSVSETDSRFGQSAYVYVLLSEPAVTDVVLTYGTRDGNAIAGSDYSELRTTSTLTIPAGETSGYIRVTINGDDAIEGDEALSLVVSAINGARFEDRDNANVARILIRDDDGGGTSGSDATGPEFNLTRGAGNRNDVLVGTAVEDLMDGRGGNDRLFAFGGDDTLFGGAGNDTLDGGAGADVMNGGPGSDTFFVDDAGDRIAESRRWDGEDTVISSVSFRMGRSHIENLELTGDARVGAGNGLKNVITGSAGDNILDGGGNVDTLIGGAGNDTYLIRSPGDNAVEVRNGGIDTVKAYRSHALEAHIENLFLQGTRTRDGDPVQDLKAIGNALSNVIVGNPFDNALFGREGRDNLKGQGGADNFVFDTAATRNNVDRILDFDADEGDQIYLSARIFGLQRGALDAEAFTVGRVATEADDRLIFDPNLDRLYYDADGAGGAGQQLITTFALNPDLNAEDIIVF